MGSSPDGWVSPSVFQKLQDYDPQSIDWIFGRIDEIQSDQRPEKARGREKNKLFVGFSAFFNGFADVFNMLPPLERPALPTRRNRETSFSRVKTILKTAIRDYMTANNITADDLGLTDEEKANIGIAAAENLMPAPGPAG